MSSLTPAVVVRLTTRFLVLLLVGGLLLSAGNPLWGQDQPPSDSFDAARAWLDANAGAPQTGAVLLRSIQLATTIAEIDEIVSAHVDDVYSGRDRAMVLEAYGSVLELANRYADARRAYEQALEDQPGRWSVRLRHAALLIEAGQLANAEADLTRVIQQSQTRAVQREAAILRARSRWLGGMIERAMRDATSLVGYESPRSPHPSRELVGNTALFLMHELSVRVPDADARAWAEAALVARGAQLPEAVIASGSAPDISVGVYPSPSRILGLPEDGALGDRSLGDRRHQENFPDHAGSQSAHAVLGSSQEAAPDSPSTADSFVGIQTGSFRDPENAAYMAEDIRALGFEPSVEEAQTGSGVFYRVIVRIPDAVDAATAQPYIVELKERGVEGFLIFQ